MEVQSDPASVRPLAMLQQYWGYSSFRPLQRDAIACAMQGVDSLTVLPTGGGKSLCYQVPALCTEKLAVVVSPLISLMKDQVDGLIASGIPAASVHSAMSEYDRRRVADQVRGGELRLLYLAPKRLVLDSTTQFLRSVGVAFFAIDEAHCISSWGHDFRPEYRQLSTLKAQFPGTSVHAFTATATPRVRDDIAVQLRLQKPHILVGSFDRENLVYRVHPRTDALSQVRAIVDRYPSQSGIIYCISRKDVESLTQSLRDWGYRASPYHAGLANEERQRNQDDFIHERIHVMVATVAFGMGIDKSNVRYVIHTGMPKSLEAYQQESGRAGRDGLPAECTLLFSGGDIVKWKRMTDAASPESHQLLEAMYAYCRRITCRHRMLVEYFGQDLEKVPCNACDVCLKEIPVVEDALTISQKIISCVHRLDQRFGANHVALVLVGSRNKRVLEFGHDKLSTWSLLSDYPQRVVVDWIEQLIDQGCLAKTGEYDTLQIAAAGRQVLRGEVVPSLYRATLSKPPTSSKRVDEATDVDSGLWESLRTLRLEIAQERNVPPFVIFHDTALRAMATSRPSTINDFACIPGVGSKKLADFGERFVARITQYCADNQLSTGQVEPWKVSESSAGVSTGVGKTSAKSRSQTKENAFARFARGASVADVAEQIGRARSTVIGYLEEYILEHQRTDSLPWVEAETLQAIDAAVCQIGSWERLAPIKERLGEQFSYDQIRIAVACLRVRYASQE